VRFETSKLSKVSVSFPEVPGVSHHADEVFVVVDGRADAAVVVDEIVLCHLQAVTAISTTRRVCALRYFTF